MTNLFDWLIDFVMPYSQLQELAPENAARYLRAAAKRIYETPRFGRRGEFGELLLHVILRQEFGSEPAISKMYYKDHANDTVKGFDAVHVVAEEERLELWLGEAKFYNDLPSAIRAVIDELKKHSDVDYLRGEFAAIVGKIDEAWPHAARLTRLLDPNTSLDEVFDVARVPVLLTYDSETLATHSRTDTSYVEGLTAEVLDGWNRFRSGDPPTNVDVLLILVPLDTKIELVTALHQRLQTWQNL